MQPQVTSNVIPLNSAHEIGRDYQGNVWAEDDETGRTWVVRREATDEQRERRERRRLKWWRTGLLLLVIVLTGIIMMGVVR